MHKAGFSLAPLDGETEAWSALPVAELALRGGTPVRKAAFPRWPFWDSAEREALARVLESGNWGGFPSPNVEASLFAASFARAHDASFGLCAANGTVTLLLALRALGITRGDEVIVPPMTFMATAGAVVYMGALPVFADVRASDYTLDVQAVEASITPRTKAVVVVHLGSSIADLDALVTLCRDKGLALIEDCAHMHGGKWRGRGVGSWGDFGSFSFQSSKLMTAGEGGALLARDEIPFLRALSLVNCGRREGLTANVPPALGYNFRLSEFQAALLGAQLERLDAQNARRAEGVDRFERGISAIPGVKLLTRDARVTTRSGYKYIFKFESQAFAGRKKAQILAALEAEGIPADDGYEVLHRKHELFPTETFARDWYDAGATLPRVESAQCPVADAAQAESIWLGHEVFLGSTKAIDDIIEAVAKVQRHAGEI